MDNYRNAIINENCLTGLKQIPDGVIDCCITSPPYWAVRDYATKTIFGGNPFCDHRFNKNNCIECGAWLGELGQEHKPSLYVEHLTLIFKEVFRVLKTSGTLFVNIDDTYSSGSRAKGGGDRNSFDPKNPNVNRSYFAPNRMGCGIPDKSLCLIPEIFLVKMIEHNWILRNKIIWRKPNQMPESAKDRFTNDFEFVYFFVKNKSYYFNQQKEVNGRNMRSVWDINTTPFKGSHFAVYPEELIGRILKAGCPENGIVLDPFMGAGTTALVAKKLGFNYTGFEMNKDYFNIANERLYKEIGMFL